jgi:CRISPR/Cas system CSM-associated protein Csm3 (group 7 of RAMP superfamily)
MARPLSSRIKIKAQIVTNGPLHVGAAGDSPETDMPFTVDGQGRCVIPGTGVTGPLRAWVCDHYDDATADRLFGFQRADEGEASLVLVEDAVILNPSPALEIWDGVGIDREYGAAARAIKFDRAVLPKGTRMTLAITAELMGGPCDPHSRAVLGHLLRAMCEGDVTFGGGVTRGQGSVRLDRNTLAMEDQDWSSKQGVLDVLAGRSPGHSGAAVITTLIGTVKEAAPKARQNLEIIINWRPDGPVMSKAGEDGDAVDMLPFVSAVNPEQVGLALPGSGLKGALRARAERIVRTVRGYDPAGDWAKDARQRHREQVEEHGVSQLFGQARPQRAEGFKGRSAIAVDTCYSADLLRASAWKAIAAARADTEDRTRNGLSPLYKEINNAGWLNPQRGGPPRRFEQGFHVAIDRWLGSAAEHFLFSALEPWDLKWAPIRLQVDVSRLEQFQCVDQALALLLLVLRDLAAGRLPIGYGANRGFASIEVLQISFLPQGADLAWLKDVVLPRGDISQLPPAGRDRLQSAWTSWIEQGAQL